VAQDEQEQAQNVIDDLKKFKVIDGIILEVVNTLRRQSFEDEIDGISIITSVDGKHVIHTPVGRVYMKATTSVNIATSEPTVTFRFYHEDFHDGNASVFNFAVTSDRGITSASANFGTFVSVPADIAERDKFVYALKVALMTDVLVGMRR
jgi:hypothetical protein